MGDRPLVGVRVLELAEEIAGPYGGKLLLDLGADVVKAEPPEGDPSPAARPLPARRRPIPRRAASTCYLNAGKRGITLDLETAGGRGHRCWTCAPGPTS